MYIVQHREYGEYKMRVIKSLLQKNIQDYRTLAQMNKIEMFKNYQNFTSNNEQTQDAFIRSVFFT